MHLINKKTRLKYHRCTASIYSGHQANILSKLLFMFTCFTKNTIKYMYRKRKTIPQTFFNFAVFCFFVTISLRLTQIKIILRLWLLVRSTFLRRNKSHSSVSGLWLFIFHWICICRIRPQSPLLHRDWPFMFHSSILQTKRKNVDSIYITKC